MSDPLDDLIRNASAEEQKAGQLRSSLAFGMMQNPDQRAKAQTVAGQLGTTPQAAQDNLSNFERAATRNTFDFDGFIKHTPKLATWAANPENAAIAHDDLGTLQELEKITQDIDTQLHIIGPKFFGSTARAVGGAFDWAGAKMQEHSGESGYQVWKPLAEALRETGSDVRQYWAPIFQDPYFQPQTGPGKATAFVGDIGSMMGKAYLAGQTGGAAVPFLFGAEGFGEAAGSALETGKTPTQAGWRGAGHGTLNAALAFLPGGKWGGEQALGEAIAQGGKGAIAKEIAKGVTARVARGTVLGTGMTWGGNAINRVTGDPDTPWNQGLGDSIASFIGMEGAGYLSHAIKAAAGSKLKARSPEAFQRAASGILKDSGVEQVMIPADRFATFFQDHGLDPIQVADRLGAKNYAEAVAAGTDVVIPTADFLAKLKPEEHTGLLPDLRIQVGGLTAREAEAYQSEAGKLDLKATLDPAESEPHQAIYEQTRGQLLDAGNSERVADVLADRHARVMVNLAKMFGQDPLAMNDRFGLRIYRPTPGEGQSAVDITLGRMGGGDALAAQEFNLDPALDPRYWQGPISDAARKKSLAKHDALRPEISREGDAALANPESVLSAYREDPRSFSGKVINADLMAEHVSKTVADNPIEGHSLVGEHGAANRLANDAFEARMKEPAKSPDESVLILVGNAAVGKSTLAKLNSEAYHTVLDTNSADPTGLNASINMALRSGRKVDVLLVHANLDEAVRRNVQRQAAEGRPVPIADQADMAVKAPASFAKAADTFGSDPDVSFSAFDSSTGSSTNVTGQEAIDFAQKLRDENATRSTLDVAINAYTDMLRGDNAKPTEAARIALERGIEDQTNTRLAQEQNLGSDQVGNGSGGGRGPQDANSSGQPDGLDTLYQPMKRRTEDYKALRTRMASLRSLSPSHQAGELTRRALEAKLREDEFLAWENGVKAIQAGDIMESSRGFIQFTPDRKVSIALLEKADLSTFIHESGHMYLEAMGDLAHEEGASGPGVESYRKVLDFLGVQDRAGLTTAHHEKFARAMEAYAMEGKAPTPELKTAFQRVKFWMMTVYRSLSDLGVKLNPEIRGVFDRMFAGEEAISKAQNVVDLKPMFATAEDMGVTPAEFEAYSKTTGKAIGTARDAVESKLVRELLREKQDWWKAESAKVREEVSAELDADPVYQAFKALSEGKLEDGTPIKLNKDALEAQFGTGVGKELPRGWLRLYGREGGMDAEAAAEILGFNSGDQLIESLKSMEPKKQAIQRLTDERMKAQHGDMMTDGSLGDAAIEALHNSAREDMKMAELRILRKKAKEVGPSLDLKALKTETAQQAKDRESLSKAQGQMERQDKRDARVAMEVPPIQAFRDAARELVDQTSIRDLQPYSYLIASRKAARESESSMLKKDWAAAGDAKQKEILNQHLYLEAVKAKEEAGAIAEYGQNGQTPKFQQRLGKAGGDYLGQWNALASRYEFRKVTNLELDARAQSLEAWATQQQALGEGIVIDPSLYQEGHVKNWREVPLVELRAVYDALKNIETVARRQRKVLDGDKQADFEDAVSNLSAGAYGNLKAKPLPLDPLARSAMDKAASIAKGLNTGIVKMERVIDHLDQGDINGPWRRYIFEPLVLAQFKEYELNQKVTKSLTDAIEAMPKDQRHSMLDIYEIEGMGKVTRKFILSMAMNWGNAGNREKLVKGMGWAANPEVVGKAFDKLNRADWEFVQKTWDAIDQLWPEIADLQRRMTGVEPPRVEREAFAVNLPDGSQVKMDGGYFPLVYDRTKSSQGAMQADTDIMNSEGGFNGPVTFRGHTKERVQNFSAPLLLDFEQVLIRHTTNVIKDISHREAALSVSKLIRDQSVRQAISETMGPEYEAMLMPWLKGTVNDLGGQIGPDAGMWKNMLMTTRSNMVLAGLSFRAGSVLVQATDLGRAMTKVAPRHLGQALLDFGAHPIETTQMVRELSKEMRGRSENLDRDTRAMLKRTQGQDGWMNHVQKVGMEGLAWADTITSVTTWKGAYEQALEAGSTKEQAIREADRTVRLTMMSSAPKDLVAVQRVGDVGMKFITMFMGDATAAYGTMNEGVRQIAMGKDTGSHLFKMAMVGMILPILGQLIKNRGPRDDEDKAWWVAKNALLSLPSSIPIARDIAQSLDSGQDYKFTPVANAIDKSVKAVRTAGKLTQGKAEWDDVFMQAFDATGTLGGLPGTSQIMTTTNYLRNVKKGKQPASKNTYELLKNSMFGPPPKGK